MIGVDVLTWGETRWAAATEATVGEAMTMTETLGGVVVTVDETLWVGVTTWGETRWVIAMEEAVEGALAAAKEATMTITVKTTTSVAIRVG